MEVWEQATQSGIRIRIKLLVLRLVRWLSCTLSIQRVFTPHCPLQTRSEVFIIILLLNVVKTRLLIRTILQSPVTRIKQFVDILLIFWA